MKKICLFTGLLISAAQLFAQTKEIAFKSHSGHASNFNHNLGNELFDTDSDFGVAPVSTVRNAELDSVIFVSDSVAIMVTSEYCQTVDRRNRQKEGPERLWQAGSRKVYNHPLFSKKHSLDSIRAILSKQYNFRNPIQKTVFVGYDNGCELPQYFSTPVVSAPGGDDQPPMGPPIVLIVGMITGLALVGAWFTWKYVPSRSV